MIRKDQWCLFSVPDWGNITNELAKYISLIYLIFSMDDFIYLICIYHLFTMSQLYNKHTIIPILYWFRWFDWLASPLEEPKLHWDSTTAYLWCKSDKTKPLRIPTENLTTIQGSSHCTAGIHLYLWYFRWTLFVHGVTWFSSHGEWQEIRIIPYFFTEACPLS